MSSNELKGRFKQRPFNTTLDAGWYTAWWKERGFPPAPMPKINVVLEDEEGRPVAAGGLVLTDSNFTIPDGFCADPGAPKEIRELALQNLFRWAGEHTMRLGYTRGLIMTSAPSILEHGIILEEATAGAFKVELYPGHRVFEIRCPNGKLYQNKV